MHLKSPYDYTRTNQLVATLCYVSTHDLDLTMLALACQPDVRHQCLVSRSVTSHISNHMSPSFQRLVQLMPPITNTQVWFSCFASTQDATIHRHISVLAFQHHCKHGPLMPPSISTSLVQLFNICTEMSTLTNTIRFGSSEHHNKPSAIASRFVLHIFQTGHIIHSRPHKLKVPP
jgi:hypothetical protein